MLSRIPPSVTAPLIGGLTVSIFIIDALTPLTIAIAVLYGAVIMLAASIWSRRSLIIMVMVCLGLTILAYTIGHRLDLFGDAFGRCIVSLFAILIISFLALKSQATTLALKQRENKLRQADLRKDEFLAMLAHEIRNPLAPISSAGQVLKAAHLSREKVTEISEIIIRQADHMSGLIDDLLDVSRVSRGLISLESNVVDLEQTAYEAIEQVRCQIDRKSQRLTISLPSTPILVRGDHKRLVQVISNLLGNASHYTLQEGFIELRMIESEGKAVIEVIDTGVGIPADLLPTIFDLFCQGKIGSDRTQGGLGIGLALVKSLVEMHEGQVQAESSGPNTGSTFTITLPLLKHGEDNVISLKHQEECSSNFGMHLLLVDDNKDAVSMLALFLEFSGHHVTIAHSSEKALELAKTQIFDAYLLDIGLPGMDGKILAQHLKKLHTASSQLYIAITGHGGLSTQQEMQETGFSHHFMKPVNPAELKSALNEWFLKRKYGSVSYPHPARKP